MGIALESSWEYHQKIEDSRGTFFGWKLGPMGHWSNQRIPKINPLDAEVMEDPTKIVAFVAMTAE